MASCPDCASPLDVEEDEVEEGELISCPECGLELEVVKTNPIEVERVEEEKEEEEEEEDED